MERLGKWLRACWLDALGIALAAVFALPSLAFRFGRDQAIFHYIGREWWRHGTLPYRDAFDLKPPAIYVVHALTYGTLGGGEWAIRAVEIVVVLGTGILAALALPRGPLRHPGTLGCGALLASGWYYTNFDFWHSAQVESWESLCLVAALAIVARATPGARSALATGVALGCAFLFKTTAAIPAFAIGLYVTIEAFATAPAGLRSRQAILRGLWLTAGVLLPVALTVAFFAVHKGGLAALRDAVVIVGRYAKINVESTLSERLRGFWFDQSGLWLGLGAGAWLAAIVHAAQTRDWPRFWRVIGLALVALATFASVAIQQKYYYYHEGVLGCFVVLAVLLSLAPLTRDRAAASLILAIGLMFGALFAAPPWYNNHDVNYRTFTQSWWKPSERRTLDQKFIGEAQFSHPAQQEIADAIKMRARPGDRLHVRGFELGIYCLSGLSTPVRFVSDLHLDGAYTPHGAQDAAQDEALLIREPPRFFVTFRDRPWDLDPIKQRGYHEVVRSGLFVLLERG